ncbi:hypothetical protein ACJX0J_015280, partial [Zea mays]
MTIYITGFGSFLKATKFGSMGRGTRERKQKSPRGFLRAVSSMDRERQIIRRWLCNCEPIVKGGFISQSDGPVRIICSSDVALDLCINKKDFFLWKKDLCALNGACQKNSEEGMPKKRM